MSRNGWSLGQVGESRLILTSRVFLARWPFDFNRNDLPSTVKYTGPLQWRRMTEPTDLSWLDRITKDRPWVHVTESTLRFGEPFVLRTAMSGMSGGTYELIGTSGEHREIDSLEAAGSSEHVHVARWIDHEKFLPRCAAMVSTGGAGTIMAAILAGIPQVVIPTAWDKPDNALRISKSGAGIWLAPRDWSPERLRAS